MTEPLSVLLAGFVLDGCFWTPDQPIRSGSRRCWKTQQLKPSRWAA
jgi:hypothetical protein